MTNGWQLGDNTMVFPNATVDRPLLHAAIRGAEVESLSALFAAALPCLQRTVPADLIALFLLDAKRETATLREVHSSVRRLAGRGRPAQAVGVLEGRGRVYVADTSEPAAGILRLSLDIDGGSVFLAPFGEAGGPHGLLAFGSRRRNAFAEKDLDGLEDAARLLAMAAASVLTREDLNRERDRLSMQRSINEAIVGTLGLRDLLTNASSVVRRAFPEECVAIALWDDANERLSLRLLADKRPARFVDIPVPLVNTPPGAAFLSGEPCLSEERDLASAAPPVPEIAEREGYLCACTVPLRTARRTLGAMMIGSHRDFRFDANDAARLLELARPLAVAIEASMAFEHIEQLNRRLDREIVYLREELDSRAELAGVIGKSEAIRDAMAQIETVAPTGATVLLLGETGTGKERAARAIHELSGRAGEPFVTLNCAAAPAGLLESELFGHEKGAFTGAVAQRIGRFEVADSGTIFLDEIAEMPLELQSKMLRVLQEREFERLGSTVTRKTGARVVAATNRDLKREVAEGRFREDLYYRLDVFPIRMPPLRVRRDDIPLLAAHFAQGFARNMGKSVDSFAVETLTLMTAYSWPGNVRELQNVVERAVIRARGPALRIPPEELRDTAAPLSTTAVESPVTLEETERRAIVKALADCNGLVSGPRGAAVRLGMKRTSLLYRMEKLGIPTRAR